jgi:predicted MFS family arabinose efflux permease
MGEDERSVERPLSEGAASGGVEEAVELARSLTDEGRGQLPQVLSALRNRNFRLFWSGNFLSNIGTWMQNVALGWLVLTLTSNSAFWLGVVGFAGSIPLLFFTLFGGVIADRVNKRRLLLHTQSAMMILAFLLAVLTYTKLIVLWEVALISFLNGVALAMNNPSYQALVPRLVKREDLTNAIALNSAQFNMSRILGPTLGGYAMALCGMAGNFFLNGLSFLAVLVALVRIRYPREKEARRESMLSSLRAGFGYVRSQPQMRVLVVLVVSCSLLLIPIFTFIPYFARTQLGADERGLGWLMAYSGIGAVLGAVLVAWRGQIRHRGAVIAFSGVLVMCAVIVFCFSHSFLLSTAMMFVEGFGTIQTISAVNVAMQHLSSDEMRGRVSSIYGTCFMGIPPLGALLAGELSRHVPTAHVLAAMSALCIVIFLSVFAFSPALRELD